MCYFFQVPKMSNYGFEVNILGFHSFFNVEKILFKLPYLMSKLENQLGNKIFRRI
jgi:hypothetical protein